MTGTTISASSVYVEFGYEDTFQGGSTNLPILFGKEQKITGLSYNTNKMNLGQLYSPEIEDYVWNRNEGEFTAEYVFSHPWNMSTIFGNPKSTFDTGSLYTHTWVSNPENTAGEQDPDTRSILSMAVEIGAKAIDNADNNFVRHILGAISPTMSFQMSLNEPIRVSQKVMWGKETDSTNVLDSTIGDNDDFPPYYFGNAQVSLGATAIASATISGGVIIDIVMLSKGYGFSGIPTVTITSDGSSTPTATANVVDGRLESMTITDDGTSGVTFATIEIDDPASLTPVATVQDFNLNVNSNAELLWELGDPDAVNAWRKILEMDGKLNLTIQDSTFFSLIRERKEQLSMEVLITNGLSGNDLKQILMTFTGIGFGIYNNTGIEPGELALQDVDFTAKSVTVVATNDSTTQPASN